MRRIFFNDRPDFIGCCPTPLLRKDLKKRLDEVNMGEKNAKYCGLLDPSYTSTAGVLKSIKAFSI